MAENRKSSMKTKETDVLTRFLNVHRAYMAGKNPWVTIDNPNREQTNKRKIRVRATEVWGDLREKEKNRFIIK